MHAWVNGQLLADPEAPAIGVTDHGLTVGDGVFEAIKVVDGQPFALTRHLERLARSAAALGLPEPDPRPFRGAVGRGARRASSSPLGRLRITYTGGPAPLGSGRGDGRPDAGRRGGADGPGTGDDRRRTGCRGRATSAGRSPGIKSTSYAENVVALAEAARARRQRGDLRQPGRPPVRGHRVQRRLRRRGRGPHADAGRRAAWPGSPAPCCSSGATCVEVDEPIEVLDAADEIFLLSTTRDVQGVHRLDGRELEAPGTGHPRADGRCGRPRGGRGHGPLTAHAGRDGLLRRTDRAVSVAEDRGELVVEVDEGALLAVGDRLEHRGRRSGRRLREPACTSSSPSGEQSSMMTTALPSELRQGHTWTSPSPVGS